MIDKYKLLDFLIGQKEAYYKLSLNKTFDNSIIYKSKIEAIDNLIEMIKSKYFDKNL